MKPNMPSLFDDEFFSEYEKKENAEAPEGSPDKGEKIPEENTEQAPSKKETEDETAAPRPVASTHDAPAEAKPSQPAAKAAGDGSSEPVAAPDDLPETTDQQTKESSAEKIPRSCPTLELPGGGEAELDRQIRTELIQSDYASMIHKDYPFAPDTVEVVKPGDKTKVEKQQDLPPATSEGKEAPPSDNTLADTTDNEAEKTPALPQWELTKSYYTIGEVARLFEVNISHIRFWTNEFKLKPRTNRKGDRLYAPAQIETLRLIHYLVKVKKFTLKGAKEKLKGGKEAVNHQLVLKDALVQLGDALRELKKQLG